MKLSYDLYTPMADVPKGSAPIILLHSIIENKKTWHPIGPVLANNTQRRVYAVDLRNHGNSPWTDEYDIDVMSEDLEEFLVTHRISKVVLVGHSLGGKVAIAFALKKKYILPSMMKLSYEIALPPNGAQQGLSPVILLHGRMDSKNTWKRFAPQIAKRTGREVFLVDARNHGDSPWTDEMTLGHLVLDLDEFLTDQEISKAILVGHSMGGRTAMTYALKMPGKVEKLFVEDMVTGKYGDIAKRSVYQIMHLLRESLSAVPPGSDELTAKTLIADFIQKNLPPSRPGKKASRLFEPDTVAIKKEGDRYAWKANLDVLEVMLKSDKVVEELSGVFTGPTFFLYGTESVFDVEHDEGIRNFFPCAAKIPVEGAGHLIHQDFPEEFLDYVVNFINK